MERRVDGSICWPLTDQAAIDHVISLGHRRIGFCGKQGSHLWATDRRKTFIDTMRQRGLTPAVVEDVPKDDRSALTRLRHDLTDVTAVVAGSEQLALSVWHVAREAGRRVPEDLSIVGFDRMRFEFAVWPTFTSIDQRPDEIGRAAAAAVLSPDDRPSSHLDIDPMLVVGETTGPAPEAGR